MLVAQDILNRIDEIIERAYLDFTYFLTGDEFLTTQQKHEVEAMGLIVGKRPLIELLYLLVRQRSEPGYKEDKTLQHLLDSIAISGVLPVISDTHYYSVTQAKQQAFEDLQANKQVLKKKIKEKVVEVNDSLRKEELIQGTPTPQARIERDEFNIATLLTYVGFAVAAAQSDFLRDFTETMTNVISNAVLDTASVTQDMNNLQVYKNVTTDSATCAWCKKFYTNTDGSPRLYSLKELAANGTNDGKPKAQWKAVLGSTHPRCRCTLRFKTSKV